LHFGIDIQDVITCASFGDDRLRGLGVAGVEFPVSPLTCVVALTTLSHYHAACECVIRVLKVAVFFHNLRLHYQVIVCQENELLSHAKCVTPARPGPYQARPAAVFHTKINVRPSSAHRSLSPCTAVVLTL